MCGSASICVSWAYSLVHFLLLVLLYSSLFLSYFIFYSLDIYLFSNEKYKGVDIDGREDQKDLRGTGGGETINKIYCMKKI